MGLDPTEAQGLQPLNKHALKLMHVRNQVDGLEKYTKLIAEKEFFLMTAPEGSAFYLGDHPVVLHNDEERRGVLGGLGLAVPYVQIYLPLSAEVMLCAYDPAVLGQLMRSGDDGINEVARHALLLLCRGQITAKQMKEAVNGRRAAEPSTPIIKAIRAGEPVPVGPEQVQCYNSLQSFHAHRFVVDPDGKFEIARDMMAERASAAESKELFR